ncbi:MULTISPECIES: response regulator [unclassified Agrococcus]|uniref:response regulator n=1 Tax=unclassified Agrococcus TaxID=2615065 RepID=UPI00361ABD8E
MIRVLLVDDQALFRSGMRMLVDSQRDLEVVGEAGDGREAVRECARLQPNIVLMDVRMPVLDGIDATTEIVASGSAARVVVLTTFDLDEAVARALRAGASGFLLKDAHPELVLATVRAVHDGSEVVAASATRTLLARHAEAPAPPPPALATLTPREHEILLQVARGLSNAEIARSEFVSETTVKTHVSRMLQKLGLRDRVQAVVLAHQHGLV